MATIPPHINVEALRSEIREAIINRKVNACPITVRLAWHAAGTYDHGTKTGGSNGATMRFIPESSDGANAGLTIVQDLLKPVIARHPDISIADLWTLAGACAVEFAGGPRVPHVFGRLDHPDGSFCPANGRLPDASKAAEHLREIFYRMGFDDRAIVCLSGAHTLGSCHMVRSGYDGPWTSNRLRFDNEYFTNLLNKKWTPRQWDGPLQYEDETGTLMMLPSDLALIQDPKFRPYVEMYAKDEQLFFKDFAQDFGRLISLGCPVAQVPVPTPAQQSGAAFREAAMHGSLSVVQKLAPTSDIHEIEPSSGRTALHKAAFWGHVATVDYLANTLKLNPNVQDYSGDTALHDAARFGHIKCVETLLPLTDKSLRNNEGKTALEVAAQYGQEAIVNVLSGEEKSKL